MFVKGDSGFLPAGQTIHLVVDHLNIHRRKALVDCYGEQQGEGLWKRFTFTLPPSMAVVLIKRKLKSDCWRVSVWEEDD